MSSKKGKSSTSSDEITITNKKIINFYKSHPELNIETVNLLLIDLIENVINNELEKPSIIKKELANLSSTINLNNEQIKKEMEKILMIQTTNNDTIKNEICNFKSIVETLNTMVINKMYEIKYEYTSGLKEILENKGNQSQISITNTIEKQNILLMNQISLILNEIIPKSNDKMHNEIIKNIKDDISSTFNKLTDPETKITKNEISNIIESKYNNIMSNISEHIMKYLSLTENRITNNIEQIKTISSKTETIQEQMSESFMTYLNRYKNAAVKGTYGENRLFDLINKEYSSAEVENVSGLGGTGDILLKRVNKPIILIETKEFTTKVKKSEIEKFIRDVNNNDCSGIFLSQTSGIVGKENFQIEMNNNNILIYIHYVDYDISKINLAINTIDFLLDKIKLITNNKVNISNDMLTDINNEYKKFVLQKEKLSQELKDYYKKTQEQYNNLNLSALDLLLSNYFSNAKKPILSCDICGNFSALTKKSLARHLDACKKNKKNKPIDTSSEEKDIDA
jgi:hypothetical protein